MEEVAGYITFQTKIDDKYFEKGINKEIKDLEKLKKEEDKLNEKKQEIEVKAKIDKEKLKEEYDNAVKELNKDYENALKFGSKKSGGGIEGENYYNKKREKLDTDYDRNLDIVLSKEEQINKKIEENNRKQEQTIKNVEKIKKQHDEWKNKQGEVGQKQDDINRKQEEGTKSHNKINFGLDGIIRKVGKWALAIFSIRSAYSLVRGSISMITQENKQLSTDIQYMRWALAKSLEPVIIRIVQWAFKLMQAINYIVYKLTGFKLFGKASADAFKKANAGAKQLQKTMKTIAGFDEMNTVNSSGGGGGAGGGGGTPSGDLNDFSNLSDKFKKKLDNIVEVLKPIYNFIKDNIVPALKVLWEDILKPLGEWIFEKPERLKNILLTIVGLKIASKLGILSGAVDLLKTGISKLAEKGVEGAIKGFDLLGKGASGLAGKIGMKAGGSNTLVGALLAVDAVLVGICVKKIKDELIPTIKDTNKHIDGAIEMTKGLEKSTDKTTDAILKNADAENENTEATKNSIDYLLKTIDSNEKLNEDYSKRLTWKQKLTGEYKLNTEAIKQNNYQSEQYLKTLGDLYEKGKMTPEQVDKYKDALQRQIKKLEEVNDILPKNSKAYKDNKEKIEEYKLKLDDLTKSDYNVNVKTNADKTKVDLLGDAIKKIAGDHKIKLSANMKDANKVVRAWLNKMGAGVFAKFFPNLDFNKVLAKFPLAKGGIINLPGRGVPIGGEAGREGVLPLDNASQMEFLGQAIGRYVTIPLTNVVKLDSREIARRTSQVNSNNSFMMNR